MASGCESCSWLQCYKMRADMGKIQHKLVWRSLKRDSYPHYPKFRLKRRGPFQPGIVPTDVVDIYGTVLTNRAYLRLRRRGMCACEKKEEPHEAIGTDRHVTVRSRRFAGAGRWVVEN